MKGVKTIKSENEFETEMNNNSGKLLILDFYATWCQPCKDMNPVISDAVKQSQGKVQVLKINVDKFDTLSNKYKVSSIPHFVFIKNGRKACQVVGADEDLFYKKVIHYTK